MVPNTTMKGISSSVLCRLRKQAEESGLFLPSRRPVVLSECHEPFIRLLKSVRQTSRCLGQKTILLMMLVLATRQIAKPAKQFGQRTKIISMIFIRTASWSLLRYKYAHLRPLDLGQPRSTRVLLKRIESPGDQFYIPRAGRLHNDSLDSTTRLGRVFPRTSGITLREANGNFHRVVVLDDLQNRSRIHASDSPSVKAMGAASMSESSRTGVFEVPLTTAH
jgi:hypothetical protein